MSKRGSHKALSSQRDSNEEPSLEISASRFKARCLALIDEVAEAGVPYIVTKRGVPKAKLVPVGRPVSPDLLGSVRYESEEDLLAPTGDDWDADR
jgi:prevent-host-death family protein